MAQQPDSTLVAAALRGDTDSFALLCQRYYPALVAIAHAILGLPATASLTMAGSG